MSTLSSEITVGELAARMPASAQVFEQFGIDYCCGGWQAFNQACRTRGLDPAAVLEAIERQADPASGAAPQPDWQSAPLNLLIDHIAGTHHVYTKTQLPRLDGSAERRVGKSAPLTLLIDHIAGRPRVYTKAQLPPRDGRPENTRAKHSARHSAVLL